LLAADVADGFLGVREIGMHPRRAGIVREADPGQSERAAFVDREGEPR
jgi:hypothetical protein